MFKIQRTVTVHSVVSWEPIPYGRCSDWECSSCSLCCDSLFCSLQCELKCVVWSYAARWLITVGDCRCMYSSISSRVGGFSCMCMPLHGGLLTSRPKWCLCKAFWWIYVILCTKWNIWQQIQSHVCKNKKNAKYEMWQYDVECSIVYIDYYRAMLAQSAVMRQ